MIEVSQEQKEAARDFLIDIVGASVHSVWVDRLAQFLAARDAALLRPWHEARLAIKECSGREEWGDPCGDLESIDGIIDNPALLSQPAAEEGAKT